jgi:phosphoadenosine phosphosulfate reductase
MIPNPNESVSEEIGTHLNNGACQKLHWCDSCNVPLLTPTCYRCGGHGRRFIADAKPVFVGEKHLLEEITGKSLPGSLYVSSNRVYYRGRFLFSLSASGGQVTVKSDHTDVLTEEDSRSTNGRSLEIAVEANLPVLRYLEQQAINSIVDVVREYPTRRPVVSFSGGKDSAVVAYLVQKALGDGNGVSLFFGDTTLEHPETEDYVIQFAEHYGLPLDIRQAKADFFEMCNGLEPPSRILRWCCTVFKANPLNEYLHEQSSILSFDGIRRRESNRRQNYERISGNKKALRQLVFRPILDWSTLAVWLYIFARDIPYNPAYDKGYARVGCVICPYSTDYNDFLARKNYPERLAAWEAMLTRYFQQEYADKFDPQLAKEWIEQGLWKKRKPHRRNQQGSIRVSTCPSLKEYLYQLGFPISTEFIEYLKPLGEITFSPGSGFFRIADAQRFCISGVVGDDSLSISFIKPNFRQDMFLVERQIKKAMNCVKCGACAATCPSHAIDICPGTSFRVDETLCNHCLSCVRSDFTYYGCVALSYKCKRNWILEE